MIGRALALWWWAAREVSVWKDTGWKCDYQAGGWCHRCVEGVRLLVERETRKAGT